MLFFEWRKTLIKQKGFWLLQFLSFEDCVNTIPWIRLSLYY